MINGLRVDITKNNFGLLGKNILDKVELGLELAGYGVERTWKQEARVDTGRYKSSIGHWTNEMRKQNFKASSADSVWEQKNTGSSMQILIGTNVEYAMKLEKKYPSQGGVNALKTNEGLLLESIKEAVGEAVDLL